MFENRTLKTVAFRLHCGQDLLEGLFTLQMLNPNAQRLQFSRLLVGPETLHSSFFKGRGQASLPTIPLPAVVLDL